MKDVATHIALRRFGLGGRPGDAARIAADPRGYVEAQLADPSRAHLESPELRPSTEILREVLLAQKELRLQRKKDANAAASREQGSSPSSPGQNGVAPVKGRPDVNPVTILIRDALELDLGARHARARDSDQPFLERLVSFWSAHFAVALRKGGVVRPVVGAYEREAIRPNVLGRFADMLSAVVHHPAMLMYLDNNASTGPMSPAGRRRSRGLNENLARELMELHTLGVDGGYTQNDVTNLARILTGWTVIGANEKDGEPGRFKFAANRHEPGRFVLLGKTYGGRGIEDGEQAIADLARHPSTARHIARKLASHFIADNPPESLVKRLAATFRKTDGNLKEVTFELVKSKEAWATPPRKVVPPADFLTSLERGFGVQFKPQEWRRLSAALGQPIWDPPSPKGWPDEDDAWMGPAAVRERLRIAEFVARRIGVRPDPRALARELMGDALSPATAKAIDRAEAAQQGIELLVMSPEILRR